MLIYTTRNEFKIYQSWDMMLLKSQCKSISFTGHRQLFLDRIVSDPTCDDLGIALGKICL